jgi:hypothetical protein
MTEKHSDMSTRAWRHEAFAVPHETEIHYASW